MSVGDNLMLIGDTESDGLKYEATRIWVMAAQELGTNKWVFSFDESVYKEYDVETLLKKELPDSWINLGDSHEDFIECTSLYPVCMHNYFQHDKPLLKRFYPWFSPKEEHDSYILSQLFNPDRGLHGLDAWGKRLGRNKPEHEDWSRFSPEMLHRVIEDVKINIGVWEALMKEKKEWEDQGGSWDEAIKIEYGIADLQGRQELHGTMLDVEGAYALADEIYQEIQKIDEQLLAQIPINVVRFDEVAYEKAPFTQTGELKQLVTRWFDE